MKIENQEKSVGHEKQATKIKSGKISRP